MHEITPIYVLAPSYFDFSYFSIIFADYSNCRNILSILFVTRRYIDELQLDSRKKTLQKTKIVFGTLDFVSKHKLRNICQRNIDKSVFILILFKTCKQNCFCSALLHYISNQCISVFQFMTHSQVYVEPYSL